MYVKVAGTIAEICVMQVAKQIKDEFMSALLTLVDCYFFLNVWKIGRESGHLIDRGRRV
jgi:hypothetical protein